MRFRRELGIICGVSLVVICLMPRPHNAWDFMSGVGVGGGITLFVLSMCILMNT